MNTVDKLRRLLKAGRESGQGAGALFVCTTTGRVLMVKRSGEGDWTGHWATLGGGVEEGETPEQACRREIMEEGGINYTGPLIHMHTSASEGGFIFHNHFAPVGTEIVPKLNNEHTEYRWCSIDSLPAPVHPGFMSALDFYRSTNMDSKL